MNTDVSFCNYKGLPINIGKNGEHSCINQILEKIHNGMVYMCANNSKVLFVRFDLRFPDYYNAAGKNEEISNLLKIMRENGRELYGFYFIVWCREQSCSKHHHYHCIALLNGNKVQGYSSFLFEVQRVWEMILGRDAKGLVDFCNRTNIDGFGRNGIMIKRPTKHAQGEELIRQGNDFEQTFAHCFHWASYLAKENQKSTTPHGVRRYGSTQLPA